MAKILYRGFSTQAWVDGKKTLTVENVECVKADLYNHIYTAFGERVHMNSMGTVIPDVPFEPGDKATVDAIRRDLNAVFDYDPRVETLSLNLYAIPDSNAIAAIAELKYVELDIVDEIRIDIATDQQSIE